MTAQLTYQIIQTLTEKERTLLFDMLESDNKSFSLEELITPKRKKPALDLDVMKYLIKTCFSKNKDS
jgi:hypothetical protein